MQKQSRQIDPNAYVNWIYTWLNNCKLNEQLRWGPYKDLHKEKSL